MRFLIKYFPIALYACILVRSPAAGQPVIVWDKVYGSYYDDTGIQITATIDGGCAFIAWPLVGGDGDLPPGRGGRDVWGCKLDANGDIVWSRILGGSEDDLAGSVMETNDGGIIFEYGTLSTDYDIPYSIGNADEIFQKIAPDGKTEWVKVFGSTGSDGGLAQQMADGSFLMYMYIGNNDGDFADVEDGVSRVVIKFDQDCNPLWKAPVKFPPGEEDFFSTRVAPTSDGGFVFGINSETNPENQGKSDLCVWKYSGERKLQWIKCYGGEDTDFSEEILELPDGGFVIAGQTWSKDWHVSNPHGKIDIWLLQLDSNGNLISQRAFGGSDLDTVKKIILADDGKSVILLCDTFSDDGDVSFNHGFSDIWLVKIDLATNDIVWEKTYGSVNGGEFASDMVQLEDGSLIVLAGTKGYGQDGDISDETHSDFQDIWVFKLAPEEISAADDCGSFTISPNPVTGNSVDLTFENLLLTNPDISIFDTRGSLAAYYPGVALQDTWKATLELPQNMASGVYFVQVQGCSGSPQVEKFLKVK